MKKILLASAIASVASTAVFAQGTASQALEIAQAQEACGEGLNARIISARYLDDGRIGVRCASAAPILGGGAAGGAVATNFVPALGGLFAVVLGAAAVGGASSTSDTQ